MLPPLYAAPQPAPVAPMTQREAACILAINSALHRLGRGGPDEDIAAPLKRAAALFDAAPQPAPRVAQPLTDAQIIDCGPGQEDAVWSYEDQVYFGRAVLAAASITEHPKEQP